MSKKVKIRKPARPKRRAVVLDMDGTLVDIKPILHLAKSEDYEAFHRASINMSPNEKVLALAKYLNAMNFELLVVTARSERFRSICEAWNHKHQVPVDAIFMRNDDDLRPDYEVKSDIHAQLLKDYEIWLAVDDNPEVLSMWESKGVAILDVGGWPDEEGNPTPMKPIELPQHIAWRAPNPVRPNPAFAY